MENENLKDRIKEIMDSKRMNNKVFATETGINEGTLSLLLRGKTQPTLKHYEAIHTRFPDIAMEWLFDGKGPMYQEQTSSQSDVDASANRQQAAATTSIPSLSGDVSSSNNAAQAIGASTVHSSTLFDQGGYKSGLGSSSNENKVVKIINNHQRKITEIRVFYDDQTWESFVPKK